jgi:hypothetical protein
MEKFLEVLNEEEIRSILNYLCSSDPEIAKKAQMLAKKGLCNINIDTVSNEVFESLDFLDTEDMFHNSGSQPYGGYEEPGDVAHVMVEDALEPFMKRLNEYSKLGLHNEAKHYCMGILKGQVMVQEYVLKIFWTIGKRIVKILIILGKWKNMLIICKFLAILFTILFYLPY